MGTSIRLFTTLRRLAAFALLACTCTTALAQREACLALHDRQRALRDEMIALCRRDMELPLGWITDIKLKRSGFPIVYNGPCTIVAGPNFEIGDYQRALTRTLADPSLGEMCKQRLAALAAEVLPQAAASGSCTAEFQDYADAATRRFGTRPNWFDLPRDRIFEGQAEDNYDSQQRLKDYGNRGINAFTDASALREIGQIHQRAANTPNLPPNQEAKYRWIACVALERASAIGGRSAQPNPANTAKPAAPPAPANQTRSVAAAMADIKQNCAAEISAYENAWAPSKGAAKAVEDSDGIIENVAKAAKETMERRIESIPSRLGNAPIPAAYETCIVKRRLAQWEQKEVAQREAQKALASSPYGDIKVARADLKKQCAAEFNAAVKFSGGSSAVDATNVLVVNASYRERDELEARLEDMERKLSEPGRYQSSPIRDQLERCLFKRRLWQMESAVATQSNPNSIRPGGGPDSVRPSNPTELARSKVVGGNGKSAMGCVRLVTIAKGDSRLSGQGGRVLANNCADLVEVTWCYEDNECSQDRGNQWTISPGYSYPVSAERAVRFAACHGRDTVAFERGTSGTRFICRAQEK